MSVDIGRRVLALNTGSSSLKFALYRCSASGEQAELLLQGSASRVGQQSGKLTISSRGQQLLSVNEPFPSMDVVCERVFGWIAQQDDELRPHIVGHRVVHGGAKYSAPQLIDEEVITALDELSVYAPEHNPPAIKVIGHARKAFPQLIHVACFDTAFHRTIPEVAQIYPLPVEFRRHGLQKYGFHGLSYQYLLSELRREDAASVDSSRIIIAHLGHGASMAAIKNSKCIETTMGFSPAGGFPMSTRSGDLDPEVVLFLQQHEGIPVEEMKDVLNKRSGVLAISGRSDDFRDLLAFEESDPNCKLAVDYFCYHIRKHIGALASALNGLDMFVFSAGIGEKSPVLRQRICEGLEYLGIQIDAARNDANDTTISSPESRVVVRVICTNEEVVIANLASQY